MKSRHKPTPRILDASGRARSVCLILALIFALQLVVAHSSTPTSSKLSPTLKMCGILLSPKLVKVKHKVDQFYKEDLPCKIVDSVPSMDEGSVSRGALLNAGGKASINLRRDGGVNQTVLAHELMHAELIAEGYPIKYPSHFLSYFPGDEAKAKVIVDVMRELLQHEIIFPRMLKMGIDPLMEDESQIRASVRRDAQLRSFIEQPSYPLEVIRQVRYLGLAEPIRAQYIEMMRRTGHSHTEDQAIRLRALIDASKPITIQNFEEIAERCLQMLAQQI